MRVGIALLLLAVTAVTVSGRARYRSGYDCRRFCGYDLVPVCSTEGNDYDNECMMKCDWAYKGCDGKCPCYRPRPVSVEYYKPRPVEYYEPRPVYYHEPAPQGDCHCGNDKDPVCTYENETYDNECEATCDGKVKMCDGRCPCS